MTEFDKVDANGNGTIDRDEWDRLELEDRRREMIDADLKRDSQRRMAWFALSGMLLYPFAVLLSAALGLSQAAEIIGSMASIYFVSIAALVGAFFGFSNMGNKSSMKSDKGAAQ
jgi:hypothetical protein